MYLSTKKLEIPAPSYLVSEFGSKAVEAFKVAFHAYPANENEMKQFYSHWKGQREIKKMLHKREPMDEGTPSVWKRLKKICYYNK